MRIVLTENKSRIYKALESLKGYCVAKSHPRYHTQLYGITHIIPIGRANAFVSSWIIILLASRRFLLGVKDDCYILYGTGSSVSIEGISRGLSKGVGGNWYFCEHLWSLDAKDMPFTNKVSLDTYFDSHLLYNISIPDILDYILGESEKGDSPYVTVLSMVDCSSFELVEMKRNYWEKQ